MWLAPNYIPPQGYHCFPFSKVSLVERPQKCRYSSPAWTTTTLRTLVQSIVSSSNLVIIVVGSSWKETFMTSGSRTTPLECTLPMDKIPHQLISYLSYHSQCVCLKWGMMSSVFFPNCTYICMNTQYTYIIYYTHNIVSCVFCGRTSAQNLRKSTLTLVLYIFTKVMSCSGQNIE